jgi:hypothetical protein
MENEIDLEKIERLTRDARAAMVKVQSLRQDLEAARVEQSVSEQALMEELGLRSPSADRAMGPERVNYATAGYGNARPITRGSMGGLS